MEKQTGFGGTAGEAFDDSPYGGSEQGREELFPTSDSFGGSFGEVSGQEQQPQQQQESGGGAFGLDAVRDMGNQVGAAASEASRNVDTGPTTLGIMGEASVLAKQVIEESGMSQQDLADPYKRARLRAMFVERLNYVRDPANIPGGGRGGGPSPSQIQALEGVIDVLDQYDPGPQQQQQQQPAQPPPEQPLDPTMDMTQPGHLEDLYTNTDYWDDTTFQDDARQTSDDLRDLSNPLEDLDVEGRTDEMTESMGADADALRDMSEHWKDPTAGEGFKYWEGHQGDWEDLINFDGGTAFNEAFDHKADRLQREMNKQLAARGVFASTQGAGLIGDALAGLRAEQAMKEFDALARTHELKRGALESGRDTAFGAEQEAMNRSTLYGDAVKAAATIDDAAFDNMTTAGNLLLEEAGFNADVLRSAFDALKAGDDASARDMAMRLQAALGTDNFNQGRKEFRAMFGLRLGDALADLVMSGYGGAYDTDADLAAQQYGAESGGSAFGVTSAGRSTDRDRQNIEMGMDLGESFTDWEERGGTFPWEDEEVHALTPEDVAHQQEQIDKAT